MFAKDPSGCLFFQDLWISLPLYLEFLCFFYLCSGALGKAHIPSEPQFLDHDGGSPASSHNLHIGLQSGADCPPTLLPGMLGSFLLIFDSPMSAEVSGSLPAYLPNPILTLLLLNL